MSYQAIKTAAQNYGDTYQGKRLKADRPPPWRSQTSSALLASDPTEEAPRCSFHELELGTVFQAEALAVAQFSRTPSRSAGNRYESRSRSLSPFRGRRARISTVLARRVPLICVQAAGTFPVRAPLAPVRDP